MVTRIDKTPLKMEARESLRSVCWISSSANGS